MNFIEMALHRHCASVHFSIQPTYTPTRDGRHRVPAQGMQAVGRSVGVVSNSKQCAAICGIQVTIYSYPVTAGEDRLQPRDQLT